MNVKVFLCRDQASLEAYRKRTDYVGILICEPLWGPLHLRWDTEWTHPEYWIEPNGILDFQFPTNFHSPTNRVDA
ncbi:hypothetical protein ABK046_45780, partial [Streptomyces caeruleatus]